MNNLMGPKNSSSSRSEKFEPGDSKVLGALFLGNHELNNVR